MEDLDAQLARSDDAEPEEENKQEVTSPATEAPTAQDSNESSDAPQAEQTDSKDSEVSRADFERVQRQIDGLEILNKRRTSDLAELKKTISDYIRAKTEGLEERMASDPVAATDDLVSVREAKKTLQQIDEESAQISHMQQNQAAVLRNVNLEETPIEAIAQAFEADGIDPRVVNKFRENPWLVPATTVIQGAARVKAETYLRKLVPAYKLLREEYARLRGKGGDAMRQIEQVAREVPGINGKSGGAHVKKPEGSLENLRVEDMSMEQLDSLIQKSGR